LLDTNIIEYWYDEYWYDEYWYDEYWYDEYWYDEKHGEKHRNVLSRTRSLPEASPLAVSVITLGEIEYGCRVVSPAADTPIQKSSKAFVRDKLPRVLTVTKSTTSYYGALRARLFAKFAPKKKRLRGMRPEQLKDPVTSRELGIQENDVWIAAQAVEHNLVLVTADKMKRVREVLGGDLPLDIEDWTA
jgi:tRNA(fMet)-specific endonuclease VapC